MVFFKFFMCYFLVVLNVKRKKINLRGSSKLSETALGSPFSRENLRFNIP
jgi:hypothetical protein